MALKIIVILFSRATLIEVTNDLITCKCIKMPVRASRRYMLASARALRRGVCMEECVMGQLVSPFAQTDRHILRDLKMNQLRLPMHYVWEWWHCCMAGNNTKTYFFIFNPFSVYTESITFHSSVSGVGKSHCSSLNPPLFQYKWR